MMAELDSETQVLTDLLREVSERMTFNRSLMGELAPSDFKKSYYFSTGSSIFHWAHSAEPPDCQEQPPEALS